MAKQEGLVDETHPFTRHACVQSAVLSSGLDFPRNDVKGYFKFVVKPPVGVAKDFDLSRARVSYGRAGGAGGGAGPKPDALRVVRSSGPRPHAGMSPGGGLSLVASQSRVCCIATLSGVHSPPYTRPPPARPCPPPPAGCCGPADDGPGGGHQRRGGTQGGAGHERPLGGHQAPTSMGQQGGGVE